MLRPLVRLGAAPGAVGPLVREQELDAALDGAGDLLGRGRGDWGRLGAVGGQRGNLDLAALRRRNRLLLRSRCRRWRLVMTTQVGGNHERRKEGDGSDDG